MTLVVIVWILQYLQNKLISCFLWRIRSRPLFRSHNRRTWMPINVSLFLTVLLFFFYCFVFAAQSNPTKAKRGLEGCSLYQRQKGKVLGGWVFGAQRGVGGDVKNVLMDGGDDSSWGQWLGDTLLWWRQWMIGRSTTRTRRQGKGDAFGQVSLGQRVWLSSGRVTRLADKQWQGLLMGGIVKRCGGWGRTRRQAKKTSGTTPNVSPLVQIVVTVEKSWHENDNVKSIGLWW